MEKEDWMSPKMEKRQKVRKKAFAKTLKLFVKFLKGQNQLKYASDLVEDLTYTYVTSWNYVDTCRCILWNGILLKKDEDAQINMQIDGYESRIFAHKKGLPLTEGWYDISGRKPESEEWKKALRSNRLVLPLQ